MSKPAVVVVGSGLNALGVVRSLAPENVAITVVDTVPGGPAARSRFAKASLYQPSTAPDEDLLQHLLSRRAVERPVLLLTQEATVSLVSAHRDRLKDKFRFLLAAPDILADLMDKDGFQRRAAASSFPVPRAVTLDDKSHVDRAASLTYPVVLKPLAKSDAWERRFKKAYRFEAFAPLQQFMSGVDEAPPVIVQEWIDGTDSDVYFTLVYRDEAQQTCASFTGRKIRQWPPQVGGTASCTAAPEFEQELSALTTRFFDTVGFVGMGSLEFKRDQRSGRFVMVEPTVGRSDYQEEVATLNGVNVVRAAYRSIAGLPPLTQTRDGRLTIWRDAVGDERSKLAQPSLQIPSEVATAVCVDALFRMNDPGPWLAARASSVLARIGLRKA